MFILQSFKYFVVEVVPKKYSSLCVDDLSSALVEAIQKLHGDFGVAATSLGFRVKYCNPKTRIAMVTAGRGPHQLVASALPIVTSIKNQPVTVRTLHLAASIRHAFLFVKKYHKEKLEKMEATLTPSDRERWKREKMRATSNK